MGPASDGDLGQSAQGSVSVVRCQLECSPDPYAESRGALARACFRSMGIAHGALLAWPRVHQVYIAKTGLLLSRGREDFSTHSRICLGSRARTWQIANHKRRRDFALELGLGLFLQYFREPAGWLRS
jgi:hypothetical protein